MGVFDANVFDPNVFDADVPSVSVPGGGYGVPRKEELRLNKIRRQDDEDIILFVEAFLKVRG